jgi:hypothetical protein
MKFDDEAESRQFLYSIWYISRSIMQYMLPRCSKFSNKLLSGIAYCKMNSGFTSSGDTIRLIAITRNQTRRQQPRGVISRSKSVISGEFDGESSYKRTGVSRMVETNSIPSY